MTINIIERAIRDRSVGESSLIMVEIQLGCSSSKTAVLCKIKAPNAQSRGIFSTWFANPILFKCNSSQLGFTNLEDQEKRGKKNEARAMLTIL